MEENEFKISRVDGTIILEKDGNKVSISQARDDDIWFSASQDEVSLELKFGSRNYNEWQTYRVFENLMKTIIGRYILNGDNNKEYSFLPQDFVDLENKTIVWHSDSGTDNVLKFEYDDKTIKISISKSKDIKGYETNAVRIRTSGSSYEHYYQEFIQFFHELTNLEDRLNLPIHNDQQEENIKPKKLSLFRKNKSGERNKKSGE